MRVGQYTIYRNGDGPIVLTFRRDDGKEGRRLTLCEDDARAIGEGLLIAADQNLQPARRWWQRRPA